MIGAVAAVAVVVGFGAFIAAQPAPVPYGEHRAEITRLSARVAATPCDEQSTLELAELLNTERDYPGTIRVVDGFATRCKPMPRLLWASYSARMQVQDFAGAVVNATTLMTNNPDDGDIVWWRAKAKRELGDVSGTEADLRRAAELAGLRAFWSVRDLATLLETDHRACEAVPLLVVGAHEVFGTRVDDGADPAFGALDGARRVGGQARRRQHPQLVRWLTTS